MSTVTAQRGQRERKRQCLKDAGKPRMEGAWKKREYTWFGRWLGKKGEDGVAGNKSRGLREIRQAGLLTEKDKLPRGDSLEKMGPWAVFSKGPTDRHCTSQR